MTPAVTPAESPPAAADLIAVLTARGQSLGCAESLTGGLVCAALTDVPGASAVVRGAVVSYATDVKADVLGVDSGLLASLGAVNAEVARQMAQGACRVLASDWGVATTGVAGPDPQDGAAVGTVFVAVAGPGGCEAVELRLPGDRAAIRRAAVAAVLDLVRARVDAAEEGRPRRG
jgi:nicotinamide-nucleotide amidase